MRSQRIAGLDIRDIQRLSSGRGSLVDEVESFVRRMTSRRSSKIDIQTVISEVASDTGVSEGEAQWAFDIAYRDHRIVIDKDGFVRLVDGRKRRSRALKSVRRVSADALNSGVRSSNKRGPLLQRLVDGFRVPAWAKDRDVWEVARAEVDPDDDSYWGRVIVAYRRLGGRIAVMRAKVGEFQPRPFDVHAPIWTVGTDGMLVRDLATIQGFVAMGVPADELENELVELGMERGQAITIINEALNSELLI